MWTSFRPRHSLCASNTHRGAEFRATNITFDYVDNVHVFEGVQLRDLYGQPQGYCSIHASSHTAPLVGRLECTAVKRPSTVCRPSYTAQDLVHQINVDLATRSRYMTIHYSADLEGTWWHLYKTLQTRLRAVNGCRSLLRLVVKVWLQTSTTLRNHFSTNSPSVSGQGVHSE